MCAPENVKECERGEREGGREGGNHFYRRHSSFIPFLVLTHAILSASGVPTAVPCLEVHRPCPLSTVNPTTCLLHAGSAPQRHQPHQRSEDSSSCTTARHLISAYLWDQFLSHLLGRGRGTPQYAQSLYSVRFDDQRFAFTGVWGQQLLWRRRFTSTVEKEVAVR